MNKKTLATFLGGALVMLIAAFLFIQHWAGSIVFPIAAATPNPADVYVRQDGIGTVCSQAEPCSMSTGLNQVQPGQTLEAIGIFTSTVNISKSGVADARITIRGNGAVIDTTASMGIAITGNYINVSGFEIVHVRQHALWNIGKHNIIENNVVHDSVTENGTNGNCTLITGGGWASGISIKLDSSNCA